MKQIELFAGCGGLSLGFKNQGFELVLANELSPMAAETFAFNHLNEDLTVQTDFETSKTFWLNSRFSRDQMSKRLREEPLTGEKEKYRELDSIEGDKLEGSMVVGCITELNELLSSRDDLRKLLSADLDVVSGGPPCQSFSMAGLRDKNSSRNTLPWEFAKFVGLTRPKIALLENVTGILRPFTEHGEQFHAWVEVARAFAEIDYLPICLHINAKYAGAGQNRPRFVMVAIHSGLLSKQNDPSLGAAIREGNSFLEKVRGGKSTGPNDLKYFDIEKEPEFFKGPIFGFLARKLNDPSTVKDAIGDLRGKRYRESEYVSEVNSLSSEFGLPVDKWRNHELRENNPLVQARFRLYQILSELDSSSQREITAFLKDPENSILSAEVSKELLQYEFLRLDGSLGEFSNKRSLVSYLVALKTKKRSQRALVADKPAPAALSIPDDACHWDKRFTRTLTVREMARIQSFPDWFVFRSKVTTGGKMRRYEVPQYTQVGNAVPPLLGLALAQTVKAILQTL